MPLCAPAARRACALVLLLACLLAPAPAHCRRLLQEQGAPELEMLPPGGAACPPLGFDSVPNLDWDRFFNRGPWYIQQQVPVAFEPADFLYCVRVAFSPLGQGAWQTYAYSNRGAVNGPVQRTSDGSNPMTNLTLAVHPSLTDPNAASKLTAGIGLPQLAPAPYWVVALGPNYQWAIVSGGPPTRHAYGGCAPETTLPGGEASRNGLWLYSRSPVDPAATAAMRAWLEGAGLDTTELLPVAQQGCRYDGALPL